jgi:hypothetical protein
MVVSAHELNQWGRTGNEADYVGCSLDAGRHRRPGAIFRDRLEFAKPHGYTTSRGTYVAPYVATNPNNTQRDNYSATGNVSAYTGAVGHRNPRY